MDVQFIASTAVITRDPKVSRKLYVDALGLPLSASDDGDYISSEDIGGSKHFGVWPLSFRPPRHVSALRTGRSIDPCRKRASSSRWATPTPSRWPRTN